MDIWILKPLLYDGLVTYPVEEGDNPWDPWYDKAFGFVVIAETEQDARIIAHENAGDENRGVFLSQQTSKTREPWLDPKYTSCKVLVAGNKPGLVLRDFASA
jgi:hypothetical protein